MGVDFHFACGDCCEFIDLHKWPVVEEAGQFLVHAHYEPYQYPDQLRLEASPYPLVDLSTLCKKVQVTAEQIEKVLGGEVPDHRYIQELTPIVREFATRHRVHRLFLSCDLGDPEADPWWPGKPGFADWLEMPGAFQSHQYLPRNLVEIAGLESWQAVQEQMANEWPFVYAEWHSAEVAAIRTEFAKRLTQQHALQSG